MRLSPNNQINWTKFNTFAEICIDDDNLSRGEDMTTRMIFTAAASLFISIAACLHGSDASAQEKIGGTVEFDRTVHDFGDVMISDGPVRCTFTMKNISNGPVVIYNVVTTCGCTDVSWTKSPILPGKTGTISSTYSNDEGPYPFDKALTAYISGIGNPVVLRLRGVSHEKRLPLDEMYPVHFGSLGMKSTELKCGNLEQGMQRSDEVLVANLSDAPIRVSFADVTPGLSLKVSPNPVPPHGTASLQFTVTADRQHWGKNRHYATPLVDGKQEAVTGAENGGRLTVHSFTKENFSSLTKEQRDAGSRPMFTSSSYSFGRIKAGTPVDATFSFRNIGKDDFRTYKVDIDAENATHTDVPTVKCGYDGSFKVHLDTGDMPEGETLVIVTLTTNSPSRPIVNLFITGWIE